MPEAELVGPNRLNKRIGEDSYLMFERGKRQPVDMGLAFKLAEDPRFKVYGLHTREAVEYAEHNSRPTGADLKEAILEAIDQLDPDNDDHFDRQSRPALGALAEILGYHVSKEERDAAMNGTRANKLEAADPKPVKRNLNLNKAPAAPKAPTEAEAWEAVRQSGVTV